MYLNRNSENSISLLRIPDNSTWGESVTWPSDNKNYCLSGKICYLWVEFGFHNKKELGIEYATNLDRLFDNGNGANTGKIRWQYSAISTFIIFKYAPIRNPNG